MLQIQVEIRHQLFHRNGFWAKLFKMEAYVNQVIFVSQYTDTRKIIHILPGKQGTKYMMEQMF